MDRERGRRGNQETSQTSRSWGRGRGGGGGGDTKERFFEYWLLKKKKKKKNASLFFPVLPILCN